MTALSNDLTSLPLRSKSRDNSQPPAARMAQDLDEPSDEIAVNLNEDLGPDQFSKDPSGNVVLEQITLDPNLG